MLRMIASTAISTDVLRDDEAIVDEDSVLSELDRAR